MPESATSSVPPLRRYTPAQVLCRLQVAFEEFFGEAAPACEMDAPLFDYLKQFKGADELDFLDIAFELDRYFDWRYISGIEWRQSMLRQWLNWLGAPNNKDAVAAAQRLTLGDLAKFIAERAHGLQIVPEVVLGKPCLPAGAFRAIEEVVRREAPWTPEFAPSMRISAVLRGGEARQVWERLRWLSNNTLPPRRMYWTDRVRDMLFSPVWFVLAPLGAFAFGVWVGSFFIFLMTAVLAFVIPASVLRGIEFWLDPIPASHQTFRAVAYYLAKAADRTETDEIALQSRA